MKKVLALVLAVVMVVGMASIATFAKEYPVETKLYTGTSWTDVEIWASAEAEVKPGDVIIVEAKLVPGSTENLSDYSFTIKLDDEAKKQFSLTKKDGTKFYFTAIGKATVVESDVKSGKMTITIRRRNSNVEESYDLTGIKSFFTSNEVIAKKDFEDLKEANKDATVKAEMEVGEYITLSNVITPRAVNVQTYDETPSAIAEALKGKAYAYAGYKYVQALPGNGTMEMSLEGELLIANPEKVYVYEVSGSSFNLYASSASDKMWEVKDGAVEFPVSKTSQWIITDKALSSTGTGSTGSNNNNPGTGANDMVGAAVVMALVAGAGIVAFKK